MEVLSFWPVGRTTLSRRDGDHSGELRRGRRECFDEQVIDVKGVGWCKKFAI